MTETVELLNSYNDKQLRINNQMFESKFTNFLWTVTYLTFSGHLWYFIQLKSTNFWKSLWTLKQLKFTMCCVALHRCFTIWYWTSRSSYPVLHIFKCRDYQRWELTKYKYFVTVLKSIFQVSVLYLFIYIRVRIRIRVFIFLLLV